MFIGIGIRLAGLGRPPSPPPTGLWLLITGAWDDAGQWDDADTWRDA